jgi:hypothetical protein
MTFDPTPHVRWLIRPVTFSGDKENVPVLQVGYRPINGGEVQWRDVPLVYSSELTEPF